MRRFVLVSTVVLMTGMLVPAAATIHLVPDDFQNIQSAINAAQDRDTVLVAAGVYYENINFQGKDLVVASYYLTTHDPAAIAATIIDGSQPASPDTGSVVRMLGGEDSTTVLEGFTLRGGTGTPLVDQWNGNTYVEGGGIIVENASPVVRHNIIRDNVAIRRPAGITSAGGGGIRVGFGSPRIIGNVFLNNRGRYGGGIVVNFANATIKNNIIALNWGGEDYGGGGLWMFGSGYHSIVDNNTIVGNRSVQPGGGVWAQANTSDCRNNIVGGNAANTGADQIAGNNIAANFDYSDVQGGRTGTGNIDEYPLFGDSNLVLLPGSPCIDAGDPAPAYNDTNGTRNDMGAYGGPDAVTFPPFSYPVLFTPHAQLNFGERAPGQTDTLVFILENRGIALLRIDSVRFSGNAAQWVNFPLPAPVPPAWSDTMLIFWTPAENQPLSDTLLLYHNDPTQPNPKRIPLLGSLPVSAPEQPGRLPERYSLEQNFPNPFNASTTIRFQLPAAADVRLEVFDLLGKRVATLVGGTMPAGVHTVDWNGAGVASGTYVYRLAAGEFEAERTMVLAR